MCGRFFVQPNLDELLKLVLAVLDDTINTIPPDFSLPRWNIAPTEPIVGLHRDKSGHQLSLFRWGLIPAWWKQPKLPAHTINARTEGLGDSPMFRPSVRTQRLIVPMSGFYEWKTEGKAKTPHAIRGDGALLGVGGLWARWSGPEGEVRSAALLTTAATASMGGVHDRMPVILPQQAWAAWLDPATPIEDVLAMMAPSAAPLSLTPVGAAVGQARDKSGSWITP